MTLQSTFLRHDGLVKITAGADIVAGDLQMLADGRAAQALVDIANGDDGQVRTEGHIAAAAATGTTFSLGDAVWWDDSAKLAVAAGTADITAGDYPLGPCVKAKVSGDLVVQVDLNGRQRTSSADQGPIVDSTGGTKALTFAAITAGGSYAQADIVAIKNALSQIAATLNAHRTALANAGIAEGQA